MARTYQKQAGEKIVLPVFYAGFWMFLIAFSLFNRILQNKSQKSIKILFNPASSFKKHQKSVALLAIRMEL